MRLLQLKYVFMLLNQDLDKAARKDGVEAFKSKNFQAAIDSWKYGSKLILKAACAGPEALGSKELSELDHLMNTNISLAYLKLKQFSDCVQYCNKALKRRKTMPEGILEKTLYRKAAAEWELGDFNSSKQTCKDLLEFFPGNAAAEQLLGRAERGIAQETRAQKSTYAKVFQKLESSEAN